MSENIALLTSTAIQFALSEAVQLPEPKLTFNEPSFKGTVRIYEGQYTRPSTSFEARELQLSMKTRTERGFFASEDRVLKLQGTRTSIDIESGKTVPYDFNPSDYSQFGHTHPITKVAAASKADTTAFEGLAPRLKDPGEFLVIGEKWPHARREAMLQGLEPIPLKPVTTVIHSASVRSGQFTELRLTLPKIGGRN